MSNAYNAMANESTVVKHLRFGKEIRVGTPPLAYFTCMPRDSWLSLMGDHISTAASRISTVLILVRMNLFIPVGISPILCCDFSCGPPFEKNNDARIGESYFFRGIILL